MFYQPYKILTKENLKMETPTEFGIPVILKKEFSKVTETLERMGISNRKTKIITPSCYLIGNDQSEEYRILHFKELLARDGFKMMVDTKDIERRDSIITMLINWGYITIGNIYDFDNVYQEPLKSQIYVLPLKEKSKYKINHKYELSKGDIRCLKV